MQITWLCDSSLLVSACTRLRQKQRIALTFKQTHCREKCSEQPTVACDQVLNPIQTAKVVIHSFPGPPNLWLLTTAAAEAGGAELQVCCSSWPCSVGHKGGRHAVEQCKLLAVCSEQAAYLVSVLRKEVWGFYWRGEGHMRRPLSLRSGRVYFLALLLMACLVSLLSPRNKSVHVVCWLEMAALDATGGVAVLTGMPVVLASVSLTAVGCTLSNTQINLHSCSCLSAHVEEARCSCCLQVYAHMQRYRYGHTLPPTTILLPHTHYTHDCLLTQACSITQVDPELQRRVEARYSEIWKWHSKMARAGALRSCPTMASCDSFSLASSAPLGRGDTSMITTLPVPEDDVQLFREHAPPPCDILAPLT